MKRFFYIFLLLGGFFLLLPKNARADLGPKPSMDFEIKFETLKPIYLIEAQQVQCEDSLCLKQEILEDYGPQRFYCDGNNLCHSLAYGYEPFQKLVMKFSDKTRKSNVFNVSKFHSDYVVVVKDDSLKVMTANSSLAVGRYYHFLNYSMRKSVVFSFTLTILLELFLAVIYLKYVKLSLKTLISVFLINILSLSVYWGGSYIFGLYYSGLKVTLIGELFVFLLEGILLFILNRKVLKFRRAFILSLLMNLFSFFAGNYILRFL